MPDRKNPKTIHHEHRGKSSESVVDKNAILAHLMIMPGEAVLDAGCGNGYMTKQFAQLTGITGTVFALDPDPLAIEHLKAETNDGVIEPFIGDITKKTKLATASIDVIYVSTVIHGFSQPQMEGFRKEVKRLLKPNGRLAIVEIKKEDTPFGPPIDIRYSAEDLKQTIGLTPKSTIDVGQYFYMQLFEK